MAELGFPQPVRKPGRGRHVIDSGGVKNTGSVIYEDNVACIQISQNDVYHQRTKHVDTQWQFVLQYVEEGRMCVTHVSTVDQVADVLTKSVPFTILDRLRSKLLGTWYKQSYSPTVSLTH